MSKININKLIVEVEKRPALWDMKTNQYSDRIIKKQCWREICELFASEGMTAEQKEDLGIVLHKKWKNIRDNFSRDVQGRKRKSGSEGGSTKAPYMYSQQLEFLRDTIAPRETSNSLQDPLQLHEKDFTNEASSSTSTLVPGTSQDISKKRKNNNEDKIIHSLDRIAENRAKPVDDNQLFLLSMLPTLASLPKRLNSKCRVELMKVLNRYEDYAFAQSEPADVSDQILQRGEYPQRVSTVGFNYGNQNFSELIVSPVESFASYVSSYSDDSQ